jgi:MFS family permease
VALTSPAAVLESGAPSRVGLRRVLAVLCLSEITSYGVLYYAFPVMATSISAQTGWSTAAATAAFTAGLIVSALVGIPAGRWLDRYGPRLVMTTGSLLGVGSLGLIATAQSLLWFFISWLLAGVAMAGLFYPPAFTALTRWYGPARVPALTTLTLVAGLASTVFAPLTAQLLHHFDWRETYLALAAVLAVVVVPAHFFGLTRPWPASASRAADQHGDPGKGEDPAVIARSRMFLILAVAFALAGFALYAVAVNLVPLLVGRGLSLSTAALALGLGGVGQVAGRLGYAWLSAGTSLRTRTVLVLLVGAATTVVLGLLPGPAALLVAASVLSGTTRGIFTLLHATAVSDRWGIDHFGRLNGLISAPITFAEALAPAAGAALAGVLTGYPAVFVVLAAVTVAATALGATATPRTAT